MSFALLRKEVEGSCVVALWSGGLRGEPEANCLCPVCARAMNGTSVVVGDKAVRASICLRCEFAWFDGGQFPLLPAPAPRPRALGEIDEAQLPPEAREALALEKVRQLAEREEPEPDAQWKTLAGVLGMPVEFNAPPLKREPWGTYTLASLLVLVHAAAWRDLHGAAWTFGFIPAEAWRFGGATFLTSFFLHAGVVHLVGNLYFLVIFGRHVEDCVGRWRWAWLLVLATIVGNLCQLALDPTFDLPGIGASGGISGLLMFYALRFPNAELGIMLGRFLYFRWIRLPAWGAFALWLVFQLVGTYGQLHHVGSVNSLAHLGGCAGGFLLWLAWRRFEMKTPKTASRTTGEALVITRE